MARGRLTHYKAHTPDVIDVPKDALNVGPFETRASRISAMYREAQKPVVVHDYIGPVQSLREHILKLSLFPNLYNKNEIRSGF